MSETDAAAPRHTEEQLVGTGIDQEAHWHKRYVELKREHKITVACLVEAIVYALRPNCCGDALRVKVDRWRGAAGLPPLPGANPCGQTPAAQEKP